MFSVIIDFLTGGGAGAMLGASGAIYGVLMGFGMLFPNLEVMLLIPPVPIKAKYLVFVLGESHFSWTEAAAWRTLRTWAALL